MYSFTVRIKCERYRGVL